MCGTPSTVTVDSLGATPVGDVYVTPYVNTVDVSPAAGLTVPFVSSASGGCPTRTSSIIHPSRDTDPSDVNRNRTWMCVPADSPDRSYVCFAQLLRIPLNVPRLFQLLPPSLVYSAYP